MDAAMTWVWVASAVMGQSVYIAGMLVFHRRNPTDRVPFFHRPEKRLRAFFVVGIGFTVFGGVILAHGVENGWLRALTVFACFVPSLLAQVGVNLRVATLRRR
ncbi:hypothetical protein AB0870_14435 [Microbacterium proteolyticum]|uniref:hypothetical protein n=1 Tax=Microbacterium proteolyticum TaxID=1572644 RepID=UPI00241605CB|nr:hypothetical protein [Microbacterium proteolyticum]